MAVQDHEIEQKFLDLEKVKIELPAEQALPSTTSIQKEELEKGIQRNEDAIQQWKQTLALSSSQRDALVQLHPIPNTSLPSGPATLPASDHGYQEMCDSAMKDGVVELQTSDVVWMGVAGSGKTTTLARAMDEEPLEDRVSTPCAKTSTRTISQTRIGVDKEEEKLERVNETTFLDSLSCTVHTLSESHKSSLAPKTGVSTCIPPKCIHRLQEEMIKLAYDQTHHTFTSLYDLRWSRLTDSGGEPQFLEMLPNFLHRISLGIFTVKLNERLDHHPMIENNGEDGKPVGEPYKSSFSNEQIIKYSMRAFASQGENKDYKFLFLGTHLDLLEQCNGESLEDKNLKLRKIIRCFHMKNHVIYSSSQKDPIFAINAKNPSCDDWKVIKQLREVITESSKVSVSIPIRWFAMELALMRHVKETKQAVLTEEACFKMVAHYHHGQADLKAALKYLHQANFIFYFEKRGLVVADMQMLLDKLNQLVKYSIELVTNSTRHVAFSDMWLKFCRHGILNTKCLDKFPDGYIEGVFSPTDLLELFDHLCIVSELRPDEFLMPCLLEVDSLSHPLLKRAEMKEVPAAVLAVEFPHMLGSFCRLICYLINKAKWRLAEDEDGDPRHLSRNSVCFSMPGGLPGHFTIDDPFSSFFAVSFRGSQKVATKVCSLIRETILTGLDEVLKTLKISQCATSDTTANKDPDQVTDALEANKPTVAFVCSCGSTPLHSATISDDGELLTCSKDRETGEEITDKHRIWFGGDMPTSVASPSSSGKSATLTSFPAAVPLTPKSLTVLKWWDEKNRAERRFSLRRRVSTSWRQFGMLLELTANELDGWNGQYLQNAEDCWDCVMQHWLNNGCSDYPVTWEGLNELLEDAGYSEVARDLSEAVTKSACH